MNKLRGPCRWECEPQCDGSANQHKVWLQLEGAGVGRPSVWTVMYEAAPPSCLVQSRPFLAWQIRDASPRAPHCGSRSASPRHIDSDSDRRLQRRRQWSEHEALSNAWQSRGCFDDLDLSPKRKAFRYARRLGLFEDEGAVARMSRRDWWRKSE